MPHHMAWLFLHGNGQFGVTNIAKIAKAAHKNGTTLRKEAIADGIPAEDFDNIVRPEKMIGPS